MKKDKVMMYKKQSDLVIKYKEDILNHIKDTLINNELVELSTRIQFMMSAIEHSDYDKFNDEVVMRELLMTLRYSKRPNLRSGLSVTKLHTLFVRNRILLDVYQKKLVEIFDGLDVVMSKKPKIITASEVISINNLYSKVYLKQFIHKKDILTLKKFISDLNNRSRGVMLESEIHFKLYLIEEVLNTMNNSKDLF